MSFYLATFVWWNCAVQYLKTSEKIWTRLIWTFVSLLFLNNLCSKDMLLSNKFYQVFLGFLPFSVNKCLVFVNRSKQRQTVNIQRRLSQNKRYGWNGEKYLKKCHLLWIYKCSVTKRWNENKCTKGYCRFVLKTWA